MGYIHNDGFMNGTRVHYVYIYIYVYSYIVYTCTLDCPCCIGFNGSACSANKVVECCSNCPYMMGTLHDIMDMKPII